VQQATREGRDAQVEKLRAKYAARIARVTAKVRQAEEAHSREQQQAQQQKVQTAVSFGATLLGAVLGRRAVSLSTLGRATTAARGVSRTAKEIEDVTRAEDRLESAQAELAQLQEQINREVEGLTAAEPVDVETVPVKAKRGSVDVRLIALAWKPTSRRSAMPATP
jgi:DNA repair exonuclease SbcCD ATPase subunit